MKTALITGITGQDGSYLAELLLEKDYNVCGMVRRTSQLNRERIEPLRKNSAFSLIYGDLADSSSIENILNETNPDELYNLGGQSHVKISFDVVESTANINSLGLVRILEGIRKLEKNTQKKVKIYQASSSEMFGKAEEFPQKETTPFHPNNPYACSKAYAYWISNGYRQSYNMFICNGILFNHESPRRGENFVTRKIASEVVKLKKGLTDCINLGNLNAVRDWGHARDYVEAMWLMLQQEKADDYVIATGETHSVREFLEESFRLVGMDVESNGKSGIKEEYIYNGKTVVKINPKFFRPVEEAILCGDATKAREKLGWKPKVGFKELVREMVEFEY